MTAASGLPEDTIVNDFAFKNAGAPAAGDFTDMFNLVDGFFNDIQTSTLSVGAHISNQVDRGATHEFQGWVISAGAMGSPDAVEAWLGPNTTSTGNAMPTECAGVLSFHADLTGILEESGATRPRARRRGRVFIGPLNLDALDTTSAPYPLKTPFMTTLRQAASALIAASTPDHPWCVWSRTDAVLREVVGGWTDNAPDTQHRRGFTATVRNAFS